MTKKERIDLVLKGGEVDRPPICLWYHFGVQHAGGERIADIELEYFEHYDLDWLKLMNDYFYPVPDGLDAVTNRADLERIVPFEIEESGYAEQLKAIEIISKKLSGNAYFVDTVFCPWQVLRRNLACEHLFDLMRDEPDAVLAALEIITDNLISYCKRSLDRGTAGIFMSIMPSRELMDRELYLKFSKPFDKRVFSAIADLGIMNTAHVHGEDLYFDDVLDLPVNIFSWWDRGPMGPSLQYVKERFSGCVMGGIDHTIFNFRTRRFLKEHVRQGIELGGRERFLLANGCSIYTDVDPGSVQAAVGAAHAHRYQ